MTIKILRKSRFFIENDKEVRELVVKAWKRLHKKDLGLPSYLRGLAQFESRSGGSEGVKKELLFLSNLARSILNLEDL